MVTLMQAAMHKVTVGESAHRFSQEDVITYARTLVKRAKDRSRRAIKKAHADHAKRIMRMDHEAELRALARSEARFAGSKVKPIKTGRRADLDLRSQECVR